MRSLPVPPRPGEKIKATFFRDLIRAINERTPIAGPNVKVRTGPNGSVIEGNPRGRSHHADPLPWTFSCSEDPDTHEITGGWSNCILQLGYDMFLHSEDVRDVRGRGWPNTVIADTDKTDNGNHYVEIDLVNDTAKIVVDPANHNNDPENNIVRIFIGQVSDRKLIRGMHHNPVVYRYV